MGIQFPPIAFLYLLYLFIYVFFSYIIHIFVQWYKALLNLNIKLNLKSLESVINIELQKVCNWLNANKLTLNTKKFNFVIFRPSQIKEAWLSD